MNIFHKISFVYPYFIFLVVLLPLLIKFLITAPLLPKLKKFPSIIFLANQKSIDQKSEKLNYPILVLRLLIILFLIFALSNPIINAEDDTNKNYLIIIDNGWASGTSWNEKKNKIINLLSSKKNKNQNFTLITTTEYSKNKLSNLNKKNSLESINFVKTLKSFPWYPNYNFVKKKIEDDFDDFNKIYWFTENIVNENKLDFKAFLENYNLTIISHSENDLPPILRVSQIDETKFKIEIEYYKEKFDSFTLNCFDSDQRLIFRQSFEEEIIERNNKFYTTINFKLPYQIKEKISHFQINDINSVSAKFFLNKLRTKKVIGISSDKRDKQNFQKGNYYIKKGIEKNNFIVEAKLSELLKKDLTTIFVDDSISTNSLKDKILLWIEKGGIIIKLGGPNLLNSFSESANNIFFNKLSLSEIETTLQSKLSLKKNLKIKKELEDDEIFYGIDIPNEIRIKKYIQLKSDYLSNNVKVLLKLENGAPIISSVDLKKGRIIFFHIPANNSWSNLPLSFSFIEIIQRLIDLSKGVDSKKERVFKPSESLDSTGNFFPASSEVLNINSKKLKNKIKLSYSQPPGIYKDSDGFIAVNFGNNFFNNFKFSNINNKSNFNELLENKTLSLRPILISLAIFLFLIDTLITFYLRGLIRFDYITNHLPKIFIFLFFIFFKNEVNTQNLSHKTISNTTIAYILTKNSNIDNNSKNGFSYISKFISNKTASVLNEPKGIDLSKEELFSYPLIYWPILDKNTKLGPDEAKKIEVFLDDGGLLLVDCKLNFSTFDLESCITTFKKLIDISKLSKFSLLTKKHGIAKSFYLMNKFPGIDNNQVYYSKINSQINDNAASVVIGNNNWSDAWAKKTDGNFMFPILNNSQNQRITSIRFGVNLVLYALTGNYKTDQIHIPEILKRMNK